MRQRKALPPSHLWLSCAQNTHTRSDANMGFLSQMTSVPRNARETSMSRALQRATEARLSVSTSTTPIPRLSKTSAPTLIIPVSSMMVVLVAASLRRSGIALARSLPHMARKGDGPGIHLLLNAGFWSPVIFDLAWKIFHIPSNTFIE